MMGEDMISKPGGTMTSVMRDAKDIKAAYRLLDRQEVTHEAVCRSHFDHVRRSCRLPGLYLMIEDSTTLAFAGRSASVGLGPIGDDYTQGLWMHSTLAVRARADACGCVRMRAGCAGAWVVRSADVGPSASGCSAEEGEEERE